MSASLAPDTAREVRAMLTCPIGAASSSDLTGALCPRIATNPRMTWRAVANCCQWVRRIFTIPGQPPGQPPGHLPGQPPGQQPGQPPGQPPGQTPGQPPGQPPGRSP